MIVNIIGACQALGCSKDGVQFGPDSLRENGLIRKIGSHCEICDSGNIYNDNTIQCKPNNQLKNIEAITDFNVRLSKKVYDSISKGYFPLVIGGDHSLGIGSVCGAAQALGKDNTCIIWLDAHTDINTQDSSTTGNIHGMTLASALGLGCEELSTICGKGAKIKAQNLVYVGSRDIEAGEADIIAKENISVFHMNDINKYGVDVIADKLRGALGQIDAKYIYLSVDIDVLDPNIAPGTGVPVPNGLNVDQLYKLVESIVSTGKVRGFELVEVNPLIDRDDNKTVLLGIDILEHLVINIQKYKSHSNK